MRWAASVWSELFGLFVDDAVFAASILAWLIVAALLGRAGLPPGWWAVLLPAGLIAILAKSAFDRSRR